MGVAKSEIRNIKPMTLVVPTPDGSYAKSTEKSAKKQVAIVKSLEIKTKDDVGFGSAIGTVINGQLKTIEAERLEITRPLNDALTAANNLFKRLKAPFQEAKELLTDKITEWHTKEETRIREENEKREREEIRRRKIQDSHKDRGHKVSDEIPVVDSIAPKDNKIGSGHITKTWTFEVLDKNKVPEIFKKVDEVEVRDAIRAGKREIPGLRIFHRATTVFK